MRRYLRMISCVVVLFSLVVLLVPTARAAGVLITSGTVNFRASASLDAEIIRTLDPGTSVEVLDHDPAGWSKVTVGGISGYIKSEYLTVPAGVESAVFETTGGVNFRSAPSLDADIITAVPAGTGVNVLEHNPAGWSRVRFDGTVGYMKSEFLALSAIGAEYGGSIDYESLETLKTIEGVNLRSGPSVDSSIIRVLDANTSVAVIERGDSGWTKVVSNDTVGYIRSDLLSVSGFNVELLDWSVVRNMIPRNQLIYVIDVRTGRSYYIKCFSIYDHADVEPATQADTDIFYDIRNGIRSWDARPVWVQIGDHLIAASLHGMPHDVSWIPDNGMPGHICLHFLGSTTSSTSASYKADLQNAVQEAWAAR